MEPESSIYTLLYRGKVFFTITSNIRWSYCLLLSSIQVLVGAAARTFILQTMSFYHYIFHTMSF